MAHDLTVAVDDAQVPIYLGDNTQLAGDQATLAAEYAADAEAASAILGGAAPLGGVPTSNGVPAGVSWEDRGELSAQPVSAIDTSVTTEVQAFNYLTNPGTRATLASDGTNLTITAGASIGGNVPTEIAGTTRLFGTSGTFVVEGAINTLPSAQTGLAMAWLNGAPVPGAAAAVTPAGSCHLIMRGNGTIGLYQVDGSTTFVGSSVTFPGGGGSPGSVSTFTTEECRLIVTMTSATTAICVPQIAGVAQLPRLLSGLPSGCYFGGGLRIFGATCDGEISRLEARGVSFDVPSRVYVLPGATNGDGSRDAPFGTLSEVQFITDVDASRRDVEIVLLGGEVNDPISLEGSKYRNIRIVGAAGQKAIINPTVAITSGWTLVSGAVWKRLASDAVYVGNSGYGGYVQTGVNQSDIYGPAGYQYEVEGFALYSRLAPNTAAADGSFVPGSYSRHNTGGDSGYDFIRCWDDGDPNGKTFRRSIAGWGIAVVPSDQEGYTMPKVSICNLEIHYAFLYGVYAPMCEVEIHGVHVRGSQVGFGMELDGSCGRVSACEFLGMGYDGIHADGTLTVADRAADLIIENCVGYGMAFLPQGFADFMSAHIYPNNRWHVRDCYCYGVGKDGAAMSGESYFSNFNVWGAIGAGVTNYAEASLLTDTTIKVAGGVIEGCGIGINANCGAIASSHRTIDVTGTILLDNDISVLAHATGTGSPTATVNALMVTVDGGGAKDTNGTGVINQRLSPTLV